MKQFKYIRFTTNDDRPSLYLKGEPSPARLRLELPAFLAIYQKAGETKEHKCQLTVDALGKQFAEVRDATGLFLKLPEGKTPPSLYEVKSLGTSLYSHAGYDLAAIQDAVGHSDPETTAIYTDGHELPYQEINLVMSEKVLGGKFLIVLKKQRARRPYVCAHNSGDTPRLGVIVESFC